MSVGRRNRFIDAHRFYVDQAAARLLSQFENMDTEADVYADDWLNEASQHFNPEDSDPSRFYEQAYDESIDFYLKLSEMRNRTRLSVVAGIFHEWDKQLRGWLMDEIRHWHRGAQVENFIWTKNFDQILELVEALGYDFRTTNYHDSLNRCRLVVNTYKHGNGAAFNALKNAYPEFLGKDETERRYLKYVEHDSLVVEESHINEFSEAIIAFWNGMPEDVYSEKLDNFPSWLINAMNRDRSN